MPIIQEVVDDVVTVTDEAIAETVVLLMERAKTVAEPAGAVALAALLSGAVDASNHCSCAIISGGNVDPNLMDRLLQFGLGAAGRHLRLRTELTDRPGALVGLSTVIAEQGASADAYCLLGIIRSAAGTLDEAINCFNKSLYLKQDHYQALVHLALLHQQRGEDGTAANFKRRAERARGGNGQ